MTSSVPLQQIPIIQPPNKARTPLNHHPIMPGPNTSQSAIQPNMSLPVTSQLPLNAPSRPISSHNTMQQPPKPSANKTWNTTSTAATAFSQVPLSDADDDPRRLYVGRIVWSASADLM